jgi:FtsP/CotA-like multicopper oxidase with cupredoxin domain
MSDHKNSDSNEKKVSRREFLTIGAAGISAEKGKPAERVYTKRVFGKGRPLPPSWSMSRRNFVKVAAGSAAVAGVLFAVPFPKLNANVSTGTGPTLNYKGKVTQAERNAAAIRANTLRNSATAAGASPQLVPTAGGVPDYFGPYPNYANSPIPTVGLTPATGVVLSGFTLQNGGTGYTTPHVSLVGGGGTGATAAARVSNGVVTGITLTNAGTGYTTAPTVYIRDPSPKAKGAVATATTSILPPTVGVTGGINKFVDSLPGLGVANNLGQMIPVATPDTTTFTGSDYYEIELIEYVEKMHTDLGPTTLRGYRQTNMGGTPIHYLGPMIIAQRDRPVRVKFTNNLPTGAGGNLFIPVDTSYMGAGIGPDGANSFTQNRSSLHLHGGNTPWISDGTPHQWFTPAGETTSYPQGVGVHNVPDMPNPGAGSMTFFYTNQQSARLMFYHDHALGITRLNVYAGEAAGYLVQDPTEQALVTAGTIPSAQIPLIIQDKTFVDPLTIAAQDPTWNGPRTLGALWFPHVYMPNQNPYDITGANPMGRWDYGPWFWPPFTGLQHGALPNPYYDPINAPFEPPQIPGVPNISGVPESFMDTPVVNGTLYPFVTLQPQAYRFRILNACNDRFLNLQLYQASTIVGRILLTAGGSGYTTTPIVSITGGGGTGATARATINPVSGAVTALTLITVGTGYTTAPTVTISPPNAIGGVNATATAQVYTGTTEVGMVPATAGLWPAGWGTPDSRDGGWPDPATRGPAIIQIGTEGGILPAPALINNVPIDYDYNRRSIVVLNVLEHSLFLAPAERADVIIDFTNFAGKTLILYNDSPAPVPGFDPRLDYYTGNPDNTATGGAPTTLPGYGPNTRTVMQIRVAGAGGTAPPDDYNATTLANLTAALPAAFRASQETIVVPQGPYNAVYGGTFPTTVGSAYSSIQATTMTFNPIGAAGGGVTGVTLLAGGTGYLTAPTVTITGGGGTGATASATIAGGGVSGVTITNPGTGYTTAPTITLTGGGGTGATATATIGSGPVASIALTNPGSGYTSIPTVTLSGGGGSGATAAATIGSSGVTGISITNPGSGYTSAPSVTLSGGGGTGATATATIGSGPVTSITLNNGGGLYAVAPTVTITGGGGTGATATATITNGAVSSITLTAGGSGYTSIPAVTITGGGGAGATATASVPGATGRIATITVVLAGTGYTAAPSVAISGGGGTGATATATVPANAGAVTSVTLLTPGAGYTSPPTVAITGGGGTGATATATALVGGVASITVTNRGTGYTSAPTVGITGGGGTGATATATVGGSVTAVTVTAPGSGYTSSPTVTFTSTSGTGAAATATVNLLTMPLLPKTIQELFTTDYGRMNALLGNEVPNTTGVNQTTVFQAYIDPPVEIVKFSDPATPMGSAADGTQLWKITHNGVDTHGIHFHLFNVQVINRVGWDGAIRPPDPNELGWKDTVRMNPLEDIIVATRPMRMTNIPASWINSVPNSIRLLDPTQAVGATMNFTNIDPLANPVTPALTNRLCNFGWEYVYHCHLLGHEENDMMRPLCAAVPPTGTPSTPNAVRSGGTVALTWNNNGVGSTATGITVERATNAGFTAGLTTFMVTNPLNTPLPTTYTDTTAPATGNLWYRVRASNIVGIIGVGAYPTVSADGTPSGSVQV